LYPNSGGVASPRARRTPAGYFLWGSADSWGSATTTKSAASHVNGGAFRRSPDRRSTGADSAISRRSSVRRSQETTTGNSAVFRVRASKRRNAPRRTTMPTGFFFAMQNVVSVVRSFRNVRKSVQVCEPVGQRLSGTSKDVPLRGRPTYLPVTIRSRRLTGS
jgi:hypothetical protein